MKQAAAYPFLRILLPFLAGIGTCISTGEGLLPDFLYKLSGACLLLFLIGLFITRNRPVGSWFAVLALYTAGTWVWQATDQRRAAYHYLRYPSKGIWQLELLEDGTGKGKHLGALARVLAYTDSSGKMLPAEGRIRVLFSKKEKGTAPICGNLYQIRGELTAVAGPSLPDAFDYREYLRRKQVHRQLRADSGAVRFAGRALGMAALAADLARGIAQKMAAMPDPQRAGLLESLITGDKQGVSEDDRLHFAQTGTLHVLAVSGLHVGIIYGILLFLTGRFFRRHHPAQATIILLSVWLYALISGLAPSVFRAAFMFSLLTLGNVWSHSSKGLNTLAATACCMLCIEPRWLQDIGFLLSFSAVGGILLFYDRIQKAWQPQSKALLYIWKMSAVSIAAQLGTLPVTLYCFNSFPLWFLPANLLVIPISTLCLISGLGYLLLAGIPAAGSFMMWFTDQCLLVLQESVRMLASLPMHAIDNIYPNTGAVIAMVWLLLVWAAGKIMPARYRRAGLCIGLLGLSAAESQRQWHNRFSEPELYAMRWQQGTVVLSGGMGEAIMMTQRLRSGQVDTLEHELRKWLRRKGIEKVAKAPAEAQGTAHMIQGRFFRHIHGGNLYLAKVSVHFESPGRLHRVWIDFRDKRIKAGAEIAESVNLLNNQTLGKQEHPSSKPIYSIGFHCLQLPRSGYVQL